MPLNVQRPLGRDPDATTEASFFQAVGVDLQSIKTGRLSSDTLTALLARSLGHRSSNRRPVPCLSPMETTIRAGGDSLGAQSPSAALVH